MAQINNSVLGNISGKLGNLSTRILNGKTILASRPGPRKFLPSDKQTQVNSNFRGAIEFSKNILSLPILKSVWNKTAPSGLSGYNYSVQLNYDYIFEGVPTTNALLTPGGFDLVSTGIPSPIIDKLTMQIDAVANHKQLDQDEKDITFVGFGILTNPLEPSNKKFRIISKKLDVPNFDFSQDYTVDIPLDTVDLNNLAQYQNSFVLFTAITKANDGRIIDWSETVS